MGNFNSGYIYSGLYSAGNFDPWNVGTTDIESGDNLTEIEAKRQSLSTSTGNTHITYNFLFRPPMGLLNSSKPLLPKSEMIITFDRAFADIALIDKPTTVEALSGKVIPLKNVYLKANYYTSPFLRNYFGTITEKEIVYKYDEISVYHKNLPKGDAIIRMSNIIGGNTPAYLFAGIIPSDALNGNMKKSSTCFKRYGVTEFDLTLNGYSCTGFPLVNENDSPIMAYEKFMRSTNRKFQNKCAEQILPLDFQNFHFIYSHKFQGEALESGWLGINLKLEEAYDENYTLGKYS